MFLLPQNSSVFAIGEGNGIQQSIDTEETTQQEQKKQTSLKWMKMEKYDSKSKFSVMTKMRMNLLFRNCHEMKSYFLTVPKLRSRWECLEFSYVNE